MGRFRTIIVSCAAIALLGTTIACNEHLVNFGQTTGAVEEVVFEGLGGGEEVDILWMIDNSGSMCRSQEIVRNSIDDFVEILEDVNLDFHIGITTSHPLDCADFEPGDDEYNAACVRETVARAGHLQSTPQPVPGFDARCYHPLHGPGHPEAGEPIIEALDPLVSNIEFAVECTQNPPDWEHLKSFNETELRCALSGNPGVDDSDCAGEGPELEEFFPPPSAFRDIPLVLRSEDYTNEEGILDIEAFRDDFACASLVGTRGHGFEAGLDAVVTALSPEMTGGPTATVEDRNEYPNAGFIRPSAQTGVIFISDENDCSHDGTLNESTACGVHNCTIQENLGEAGKLQQIPDLRSDFLLNLAKTRGTSLNFAGSNYDSVEEIDHLDDLDPDQDAQLIASFEALANTVIAASLHGPYQKLDSVDVPQECPAGERWEVPTSCRTEMGRGWSGHRYEEFIRQFPVFFPEADEDDPDAPLDGLICQDFSAEIEAIAELFAGEASGCLEGVWGCEEDADCPADPYADQIGERSLCNPYPGNADRAYCETAIEVRLAPPDDSEDPRQALEQTTYCLDDTFSDPAYPNTCVVDPSVYEWVGCQGNRNALRLEWLDEDADQRLTRFGIIKRYVHLPGGSSSVDGNSDDGGDDQNTEPTAENNQNTGE